MEMVFDDVHLIKWFQDTSFALLTAHSQGFGVVILLFFGCFAKGSWIASHMSGTD